MRKNIAALKSHIHQKILFYLMRLVLQFPQDQKEEDKRPEKRVTTTVVPYARSRNI